MLPATAIDRPPRAGPIDRHRRPENNAGSTVAVVTGAGAMPWAYGGPAAMAVTSASNTLHTAVCELGDHIDDFSLDEGKRNPKLADGQGTSGGRGHMRLSRDLHNVGSQ